MSVDVTGDGPMLIVDYNETYIRIWLVTYGGRKRWQSMWLYRDPDPEFGNV